MAKAISSSSAFPEVHSFRILPLLVFWLCRLILGLLTLLLLPTLLKYPVIFQETLCILSFCIFGTCFVHFSLYVGFFLQCNRLNEQLLSNGSFRILFPITQHFTDLRMLECHLSKISFPICLKLRTYNSVRTVITL